MIRSKWNFRVAGLALVMATGSVVASARGQVPSTVREERVPPILGERAGAVTARPAGAVSPRRLDDEKAIKQVAEAFTHAFNAGDAASVARLYTDDAELIDEYSDRIEGRGAIQEMYSALFQERKGATIEISMSSLRFLGPDAAKEVGHTTVKRTGLEPTTYRDYTVLYVKQDGHWFYSSVHERHPAWLAHQERLKELEWLLGEWLDESSDSIIHITCRWSDDKNFLLRDFEVRVQSKPMMKVTQRLGWDPLTRQIKSWVFDSDGGYGDALWTRNGDQWLIKSTGVLPDGRIATATNILTRTGPNAARWTSTERTEGAERVPDHQESVMVRRPPPPQGQPLPKK